MIDIRLIFYMLFKNRIKVLASNFRLNIPENLVVIYYSVNRWQKTSHY